MLHILTFLCYAGLLCDCYIPTLIVHKRKDFICIKYSIYSSSETYFIFTMWCSFCTSLNIFSHIQKPFVLHHTVSRCVLSLYIVKTLHACSAACKPWKYSRKYKVFSYKINLHLYLLICSTQVKIYYFWFTCLNIYSVWKDFSSQKMKVKLRQLFSP